MFKSSFHDIVGLLDDDKQGCNVQTGPREHVPSQRPQPHTHFFRKQYWTPPHFVTRKHRLKARLKADI